MKTFLIIGMLLLVSISYAQDAQMKRDIEVAENILSTLLKQETNARFGSSIEGTYIEGQGALFTIGGSPFYNFLSGNVSFSSKGGTVIQSDRNRRSEPRGWSSGSGSGRIYSNAATPIDTEINMDSIQTAVQNQVKAVMKTFLTDYAHLLSSLKPAEKVLIRYDLDNSSSTYVIAGDFPTLFTDKGEKEEVLKEITAEVKKSDIDAHKKGSLSKAQFQERIKFQELTRSNKKDANLELLGSIFHRLYQKDLTESFRIYGNPRYEKIEGLGAIFNMNFGSPFNLSFSADQILYYDGSNYRNLDVNRDKDDDEEKEDAIEKMNEDYPGFIEEFKRNMVEYGRTVKNLAADEMILFKINFNSCKECDIPSKVDLSIKKSVLSDYDSNKISLEQAISQIIVKPYNKER